MAVKGFGVIVDTKLNMRQQSALVPMKVNGILGYLRQSIDSRLGKVILSLYSALVRPQQECCVWFCAPQHRRNVGLLEGVQERATEARRRLEQLFCVKRLRELGVFSMEISWLKGVLINMCIYPTGGRRSQALLSDVQQQAQRLCA